jgi:hypothetical protein
MDRNEAIALIAETAIKGIHRISNDAIHLLAGVSLEEDTVENTTTVASTGEKRPRGRPRKTDASTVVSVAVVEPQQIEIVEEAADCQEMDAYHSDTFNVEERDFPMFPDEWFAKNVEQGRKYCRDLLSARLSEIGPDATRKEIADNTQMARVSDFDAQACMKYYRAITRVIINV